MDVPSRDEFEKQKSLLEALCRFLKITPVSCDTHSDFRRLVQKALHKGDEPESWDCPECGANFREEYPIVFNPE